MAYFAPLPANFGSGAGDTRELDVKRLGSADKELGTVGRLICAIRTQLRLL
jgi:hypothetical protein